MESLDLNGLAKSLPASNFEKAEKELLNNFKASALSITTLYRSSRHASKRAYNAGYAAACQDLMLMIQQGVSTSGNTDRMPQGSSSGDMTIGRILDWIEARMDAVKSREEEEDEDEEREKEKERERARGGPSSTTAPAPPSAPTTVPAPNHPHKDNATPASSPDTCPSHRPNKPVQSASEPYRPDEHTPGPAPPTPRSPAFTFNAPPTHASPSPPISSASRPPLQTHRPLKSRPSHTRKDLDLTSPIPPSPLSPSENISRMPHVNAITPSAHPDTDFSAGAKRRHAVMMMLDSTPSTGTAADVVSSSTGTITPSVVLGQGSARRRTRSQRSVGHVQAQIHAAADAMMEVEEDGRERKRVTRR
ncbi:hypothetical protein F5I97DRAFT_1960983 [Phlebopus sp. FC_14]|nr:hypothetical protein F5I97DRAFT_1960983 [Phlebopus sp. FC_14]